MTPSTEPYSFAFTAADLKFFEFVRLVTYVEEHQLQDDLESIQPDTILGEGNSRGNLRVFRELWRRYIILTGDQRSQFLALEVEDQRQLSLIAVCKAYSFIRDFILEVVYEKYIGLDFKITFADFQSFYNRKRELHPELDEFSESTRKKARQLLFRILVEGGLLSNTKEKIIQSQFVSEPLRALLKKDNPALLKLLLVQ